MWAEGFKLFLHIFIGFYRGYPNCDTPDDDKMYVTRIWPNDFGVALFCIIPIDMVHIEVYRYMSVS